MRLIDKACLVTGAGKGGLGHAIAIALAREGGRLAVVDIDERRANQTVDDVEAAGGQGFSVIADVREEEQVRAMVRATVRRLGRLDILVNNVGIISRKDVFECSLDEWRETMRTNVDSVFLCVKHAAPVMRDHNGGAIVNISSTAGLIAAPSRPAYCASKGAIIALTRQLALDLAVHRIRVNAVAPSSIEDTGMYQTRADVLQDADAVRQSLFLANPLFGGMGRIARTQDIAQAVVFLASDDACMVTGVTLPVDGGGTAI